MQTTMSGVSQAWWWRSPKSQAGRLGTKAVPQKKGATRNLLLYLCTGALAVLTVMPVRAQSLSVSPTSEAFQGGGGTGAITVTASPTMSWTATSSQPWVTITSGGAGTGSGAASYSVGANSSGAARSATITFDPGAVTFTITQAALISQPPAHVSLAPSSGSGSSGTFSFVASSPNGYAYLDWVQMLFNYAAEGPGGCFLHYARAANVLYLLSDDGGAWAGAGSVGAPGAGSIQNSQCQVNLESSSFSSSGSNLTVNVALTFTPSFIGPQGTFLRAGDLGGMATNWQQMGTWTAYAAPCSSPPAAVSVSPPSGSGSAQTFRYTASSCNGYAYIASVSALINNVADGAHACSLYYNRAGNYFVLMNDANDGWAGSGIAGEVVTIQNSQCSLDVATSSAAGTGNNLTVDFALTFKPVFTGAKNNYLSVTDRSNLATGWQQLGTWTVGSPPPPGAGTVSGAVSQSGGSTPIAGATIQALQGGAVIATTSSGSDGGYIIGGLAPGSYALMCSANGRKTEIRSPVQVSDQATSTQNFSLAPASTGRSVKEYVYTDSTLLAIEQGAAPAVDFEQFSGSNGGDVALPALTAGIVTFSGGQLFSGLPEVPGNSSVVYGTRNQGCAGCLNTITIEFSQPISNYRFVLLNGSSAPLAHYEIQDDQGRSYSYWLSPTDTSRDVRELYACSIRRITITSNTGTAWAFWVDNLTYAVGDLPPYCGDWM